MILTTICNCLNKLHYICVTQLIHTVLNTISMNRKYRGCSYAKRVKEVNDIYDSHSRSGLSNRAIWRRYIFPYYGISEKTFYNYVNALAKPEIEKKIEELEDLPLFRK